MVFISENRKIKLKTLPGNSMTTSHCVGILLSHNRLGVIKCPAAGTRRLINLEAKLYKENNNVRVIKLRMTKANFHLNYSRRRNKERIRDDKH